MRDLRRLHDPAAALGIPAHVTILYPFLPEVDGTDQAELDHLFGSVEPFGFRLTRTDRFPGVIYLAVEPAAPFRRLTAAVATLWPQAPPYRGDHSEVVPHLTVVETTDEQVRAEAERVLGAHLPITAEAKEVWLVAGDEHGWERTSRFPFGRRRPLRTAPRG